LSDWFKRHNVKTQEARLAFPASMGRGSLTLVEICYSQEQTSMRGSGRHFTVSNIFSGFLREIDEG
jgi:hypothetical protein